MVRLVAPLGNAIAELLSIVHYKTFLKWKRQESPQAANLGRKTAGRPAIHENVKELILRFASETGWGYRRIQGELKKPGITVAANTIKKVLIKNGFHPSLNRTKGD